jgi:hypothetical protein
LILSEATTGYVYLLFLVKMAASLAPIAETISGAGWILCSKSNFLQVLDLLIFRQPGLAIDAKAAAIFTLLSVLKGRFAQNPT